MANLNRNFFKNLTLSVAIVYIIGLILYLVFGTISSDYLIQVFFQKDLPTFFDLILAIFFGSVLIPLALVIWLIMSL